VPSTLSSSLILAAATALLATGATARAADAGIADAAATDAPAADGAAAGLALPRLLEAPPAAYPPDAVAAKAEGTVGLVLTIDVEGRVTGAEVVAPLGHGLDEAATAAALRFRFAPATRDGQPIAARIRHDYVWTLPAAPAPPPPKVSPPPPPTPRLAPEPDVQDVTVRGKTAAQRLRESAEAVTVVETKQAQRESADLGEVLSRTQGISMRRTGGLGSGARLSLNGLTDDQIRFFLDGVPLAVAGFGLGLQNVPVNLVERVEIYRGVVPVRFGADALGGAVNLVSPEDLRGTRATGSAQLGSFGTYRLTLAARHTHAPTGLHASFNAFLDHADNDYRVDVEVPDEKGRLSAARVHRFHDAYDAYGGGVEVGVVDRPWAKRLLLRAYGTRQDRELQHNLVMSVPYGEARYFEATRGATLRYEQPRLAGSDFGVSAVAAVSRRVTDFEDLSPFVYDWFGRRIRERVRRGELGEPSDERLWQHTALARLQLSYAPHASHVLRLAVAPTFVDRTGRDYLVTMGRDPLSADRGYFSLTNGLEYQADLFGRRLESIAFAKSYLYDLSSEEPLPGGIFRRLDQDSHTFGYGEQLRFRFTPWLWAKASYERATRLPSPDEVFGDGVLVVPNLRLSPERSHNGNLGLTADIRRSRAGDVRADVNLFVRHAENLIVLLGNDMVFSHQNVFASRSQGVEASAGWTSPGEYLALDGNVTWQSVRNVSEEGTFKDFKGDRIPNRPYLFANLSARARKAAVSSPRDELSLAYYLRYVRGFFRGWESLGLREFKQVVPDQTTHTLAFTYVARGALTQTWTSEVQNLTDAKTYDFFGVQRPGRAFFVKVTAEY
jgi:TonB family protein